MFLQRLLRSNSCGAGLTEEGRRASGRTRGETCRSSPVGFIRGEVEDAASGRYSIASTSQEGILDSFAFVAILHPRRRVDWAGSCGYGFVRCLKI